MSERFPITDEITVRSRIIDDNAAPVLESLQSFEDRLQFTAAEAFELRCDLIDKRRSVVFVQGATYRVEVVESSPESANHTSEHVGNVLEVERST